MEGLDDDGGLYADVEDIFKSVESKQLVQQLTESNARNEALTKELLETKQQLSAIVEEKERIEANLVMVFQTALREVARKDKEIKALQAQLAASANAPGKR